MEIIECQEHEYASAFPHQAHVFNSIGFARLNSAKCDQVKLLAFKDGKYRLGLIAGIRGDMLVSPFSAPFGGFSFNDEAIKVKFIEEAITLLEAYAAGVGVTSIRFVLPPLLYHETFTAKLMNVLYRMRYKMLHLDMDYYMPLTEMAHYEDRIWYNGLKNLKQSRNKGLTINKVTEPGDIKTIYEILKVNRESKGRPMTMTFDDIVATAPVTNADFFLCLQGNEPVAATIAYGATSDIVYIPYWGDVPGAGDLKAMNFMAYEVFDHYRKAGKKIVHIGIATEDSMPNYGLGEFKESIGCKVTPKFSYIKQV